MSAARLVRAPASPRRCDRDDGHRQRAAAVAEVRRRRRCSFRSRAPATVRRASRRSSWPSSCSANVRHLVVTCNKDGELAVRARKMRNAHLVLLPEATNDRGFAMTSSFSLHAARGGARLRCDPARDCRATGAVGGGAAGADADAVRSSWSRSRFERVIYLGSNELLGLAREAALKLLELTDGRIATLAESTLGFRHGPKTIVDGRTLVVVMLSNDAVHARLRRGPAAKSCGAMAARAASWRSAAAPTAACRASICCSPEWTVRATSSCRCCT